MYIAIYNAVGDQVSVWKYPLEDTLTDTDLITTWTNSNMDLVGDTIVQCKQNPAILSLFQVEDWKPLGEINLSDNLHFSCAFQEYIDGQGVKWLLFFGENPYKGTGVWGTPIIPASGYIPELIINYSTFGDKGNLIEQFYLQPNDSSQ